jgi:hypothetical protein
MMQRVYILGAGASKAIINAAPLNDQLLPLAWQLPGGPWLEALKTFIADFYFLGRVPVDAMALSDLPPIEDVLSQLDYSISEQRPLSSRYTLAELANIREHLLHAVFQVLYDKLEHGGSIHLMK